jgi:hypothetical protein
MRSRRLVVLVTALAMLALPAVAAATVDDDLATAKRATAKYKDVRVAERDGYAQESPCVTSPAGTMGFHYNNAANIREPGFDITRPEQLLYIPDPSGKGLRLAGIEFHRDDADQNYATTDDRPTLFEHPFDGPMPGHSPGAPIHYDLHVWLFQKNPSGTLAQWNPSVLCTLALRKVETPRKMRARSAGIAGIPITITVDSVPVRIEFALQFPGGRTVLARAERKVTSSGKVRLRLRPTGAAARKLKKRFDDGAHRVRVEIKIKAKPKGGLTETRIRRVTLTG